MRGHRRAREEAGLPRTHLAIAFAIAGPAYVPPALQQASLRRLSADNVHYVKQYLGAVPPARILDVGALAVALIRIAAWRPRPSGRGGNAASPPRKCQCRPIVCSHVPVPAVPHARPASGAAGPLRPRLVRLEPRRRAALPLAPGPPGRAGLPGAGRQLTQARAEYPWLAAGSQTVQQQALRDFAQAMAAFFDPGNPAGRPSWRKAGRHEGFRIVGRGRQWDVRRVSRKLAQRSHRGGLLIRGQLAPLRVMSRLARDLGDENPVSLRTLTDH